MGATALLLLGAYIVVAGMKLGFGAFNSPGPGFVVVFAGSLLFSLSAVQVILSVARRQGLSVRLFFPESDSARKVLFLFAGPVAFALLLAPIGFFLSAFVMLLYLFRAIYPNGWRLSITLALGGALFCLIVFQLLLKVQFPEGITPFYRIREWLP
jgi:hypothetical protein